MKNLIILTLAFISTSLYGVRVRFNIEKTSGYVHELNCFNKQVKGYITATKASRMHVDNLEAALNLLIKRITCAGYSKRLNCLVLKNQKLLAVLKSQQGWYLSQR